MQTELYTAPGCPYSEAAREDLEWRGVEFVEFDDGVTVYQNPGLNPVTGASLAEFWKRPYRGIYAPATFTVYGGPVAAGSVRAGGSPRHRRRVCSLRRRAFT